MRRLLPTLLGIVLLVLLTGAVYSPAPHLDMVMFDDVTYLYKNPFIQQGLSRAGMHDAFFHFRYSNWAPLVSLSYSLDQNLFQLRPGPMHVENVLLHLITGLLLWRTLFVFTGEAWLSYFAAAVFLCHPMHVESVAWISERKDVLSTPLLLAAMLAYAKYSRQIGVTRWVFYAAMILLFALSLMAKSMGVTLPALLLLLDFWPLARWPGVSWLRLLIEKLPLLAMSVGVSVLASIAQNRGNATASLMNLTLTDRAGNAMVCYVIYIAKLLMPTNLAVFYVHPGSRPMPVVFAATVMLALTSYFCFRLRRRYPYAIVGWLWFLGTLIPVIGLVQVGGQAMADRYSYFPSIGLSIVVIWGGRDALNLLVKLDPSVRDKMFSAIATIAICTLAVVARRQVWFWQNTTTLFNHDLAVADDSPLAHMALEEVAFRNHDIIAAVDECNAALKLAPWAPAYFALGDIWLQQDPSRAGGFYEKAVALDPRSADYRIGFARALRLCHHPRDAIVQARAALELAPDDPDALEEMRNIQSALSR